MKILETKRLILREFDNKDAPFIFELLNSPGWLKYIGTRGIKDIKDAENYITELMIPSYEKNGFGFYMMEGKEDSASIGMCGLIKRDALEDVDIGFAILPQFEGKGYSSEAAIATIDYGKNQLGLNRIAAITVEYNVSSIKILEKLGMKFEKMINLPNDPEDLMLYAREF